MPELAVDEAPPDTVFAVMTHSHPLDEAICDAILRRDDLAFLGLIGSATKRARFVKRLGEAGIPAEQLARLVCPIGLPGIRSKEPTAIAASFAADLLVPPRAEPASRRRGAPAWMIPPHDARSCAARSSFPRSACAKMPEGRSGRWSSRTAR